MRSLALRICFLVWRRDISQYIISNEIKLGVSVEVNVQESRLI